MVYTDQTVHRAPSATVSCKELVEVTLNHDGSQRLGRHLALGLISVREKYSFSHALEKNGKSSSAEWPKFAQSSPLLQPSSKFSSSSMSEQARSKGVLMVAGYTVVNTGGDAGSVKGTGRAIKCWQVASLARGPRRCSSDLGQNFWRDN